ncbi:MAG: TonB family protein [Terriglobia bacterium]
MDALSRWVATFFLNSLWQVTSVAAAAALADLGLRRAPARYRHALWAMALAAAVALPAASLRTLEKRSLSQVPLTIAVSAPAPAFAPLPTAPVAHASVDRSRVSHFRTAFLAGIHHGISVPPAVARAFLILYLAFLAFSVVRFGRACLETRATKRLAFAELLPAHVVSTLERCQRAMARRRWSLNRMLPKKAPAVRVWWSQEIPGPATVGARHCAIILPVSLRDPEAVEDMTAALAHETAHVARHDYLWNLVLELLSLPIAFHPFTLLMKRRLGETRELACDELAARVLNPSDYARSLVRLADQIQRRAAAIRFDYTLGVFDANILEERIMRLLKPRASGRLAMISLVSGVLLIATSWLAASAFSLAVTPSGQSQDQAKANDSSKTNNSAPSADGTDKSYRGYQVGVIGGIMKTSSVSGIVVDISGARVPNAGVVLINRDSWAKQEGSTDATGNFAFKDLPAGRYSLEVTSSGMGRASRLFELKTAGPAPFIPFVLEPGILTESVVVTAKAPHGVSTNGAAAVGPRRIRVGGNVEAARLIDNPPPEYPESARAAGIQGVVLIEAVISIKGEPMGLKVLSSPSDDLSKAATDAVSRWRFRSTLVNGDPVEVLTTIAVAFRLAE